MNVGSPPLIAAISLAALGLLFLVAWHADRRARAGRGWLSGPHGGTVYALSLGVYATSWTFYGSVGRAALDGIGFLPVYLGPVLAALLFPVIGPRVLAIAKSRRIVSIADFLASRYDGSRGLAALVAVVAVIGVVPYIALQLKAIETSLATLSGGADARVAAAWGLPIAAVLGLFAIVFGARQVDAAERHDGLVAAIATESVLKLVAFVAVGAYVVWGLFDGWGALFSQARAQEALAPLFTPFDSGRIGWADWFWLTALSGLAFVLLPRQFQMAVVENTEADHLRTAAWLLPAYLLAINLFVLPIALAGSLLLAPAGIDADAWVLALPAQAGATTLALLVFVGGLAAATGMVIVETLALSTMVTHDLVLPRLLAGGAPRDLSRTLLRVRRLSILGVLLLGWAYLSLAGERFPLVSMGLVSFVAVAQFAPAFAGALWWPQATRAGAIAGLATGSAVWAWTMLLPTFAVAGLLPLSLLEHGPAGIDALRPQALLGLSGLDPVAHGTLWSLLANTTVFVAVSLFTATADGPRDAGTGAMPRADALRDALVRVLGPATAAAALAEHDARQGSADPGTGPASPALLEFVQVRMAGAIGTASARLLVDSLRPAGTRPMAAQAVFDVIAETSQVLAQSRRVEREKSELEALAAELRDANERLRELDRMKDDFVSTVSHELRTPLTSIRAFAEILRDHPDLAPAKRAQFVAVVLKETERLTRLINQILDLAKIESGRAQWHAEPVDLGALAADAIETTAELARERGVAIALEVAPDGPLVTIADRDRLMQVVINLLSNAVKFAPAGDGRVTLRVDRDGPRVRTAVTDNGVGIAAADHAIVFERFRQAGDVLKDRPAGTGLGLPISRRIVRQFGGDITVDSAPGRGATFTFALPAAAGDTTPGETTNGPQDPDRR